MVLRRTSLGSSKSSWLVLSVVLGCRAICDLKPVSEGAQLTTITHDGVPRSWYTYVPASVAAAQAVVPLVVDLHGLYTCVTNGWLQTWIGWISKAEEFGFILVWPQAADEPIGENGVTGGPRWNAGVCDECLCKNCVYVGQGDTCCRTVGTPAEDSGARARTGRGVRPGYGDALSKPGKRTTLAAASLTNHSTSLVPAPSAGGFRGWG